MPQTPEIVEFSAHDRATVVARMHDLTVLGRGWINIRPAVDPDDVPRERGAFGLFSALGPHVPLSTWTPPDPGGRAPPHMTIGVQHAAGTKVVRPLADAGVVVDPGWRVVQDQPRRGLVVNVPADADLDVVLEWLLRAATALCRLPFESWRAAVNRGRG